MVVNGIWFGVMTPTSLDSHTSCFRRGLWISSWSPRTACWHPSPRRSGMTTCCVGPLEAGRCWTRNMAYVPRERPPQTQTHECCGCSAFVHQHQMSLSVNFLKRYFNMSYHNKVSLYFHQRIYHFVWDVLCIILLDLVWFHYNSIILLQWLQRLMRIILCINTVASA